MNSSRCMELLPAARRILQLVLVVCFCLAPPLWAEENLRLIAPEGTPTLKLFEGRGAVSLEFDKPAGTPLPASVRLTDISDLCGPRVLTGTGFQHTTATVTNGGAGFSDLTAELAQRQLPTGG